MPATTLAEDRLGRPIQALAFFASAEIAFTSGAAAVGGLVSGPDTRCLRLLADADCRVVIGAGTSVPAAQVAASATSTPLMAGVPEVVRVPWELATEAFPRIVVSVIGRTGSGSLNVTELQ